jgi:hypothetical protein
MTKLQALSLAAAVLLASNLLLAALLFLPPGGPGPQPGDGRRQMVIARLHFDAGQAEAYDRSIAAHRQQIRQKQQEILALKRLLYADLAHPQAQGPSDSLLRALGQAQIEIEQIHYGHFSEIRGLCRDSQRADFELLAKDLGELFAPPRHP